MFPIASRVLVAFANEPSARQVDTLKQNPTYRAAHPRLDLACKMAFAVSFLILRGVRGLSDLWKIDRGFP